MTAIRFDNGAAYERYMGIWSQLAGEAFIDWLQMPAGARWLDVGCGNGAFTELLVSRCAPARIAGVDPAEGMLAFARQRPALSAADLRHGDAMALPFADAAFDAAVMPLVIFFVPEPARGVAEMARVLAPGGLAAAYAWDMEGGGFPYEPVHALLRELGATVPEAPSPQASRPDVLRQLWTDAGFEDIQTRRIPVQRTWPGFDDYWETVAGGPSVKATLATLPEGRIDVLQQRLRACLPTDARGRITCNAAANAIHGRLPKS